MVASLYLIQVITGNQCKRLRREGTGVKWRFGRTIYVGLFWAHRTSLVICSV